MAGCHVAFDRAIYVKRREIGRAVGKRRVVVVPCAEPIVWLIALGNQIATRTRGYSDSLNIDKIREALAGDWTTSVDRVCDEFGYRPKPLQHQLNETGKWYRSHGWID